MPTMVDATAGNLDSKNTSAADGTATQQASPSQQRLPNTTASLPIVYGSIAFYLGKKADELQTHEWTLFLRGPNQNDDHLNSQVVSKVVFQLHPSFAKPTRELTEPPYEVTERGWGEFEAQIRIHWKDPKEQVTVVNHTIKLYPQGSPPTSNKESMQQSTEVPVLAETYDEVVFTDPTESFFRALTQLKGLPPSDVTEETTAYAVAATKLPKGDEKITRGSSSAISTTGSVSSSWKKHLTLTYSDQEDFLALIEAQKFLQEELADVRERFQHVNEELTVVDQKLALAQQQKQREAAAAAVRGSSATSAGGERKRTKKGRTSNGTGQTKKARTKASSAASGGTKRGGSAAAGGGTSKSNAKTKASTKTTSSSAGGNKKGSANTGVGTSTGAKK